jgi:hypothetical protein
MAFSTTDKTKHKKKVIGGKAYNTATAEFILHTPGLEEVTYVFGGEYYPDEQELYRTKHGAYFILIRDSIVIGGEDGYFEEDKIIPISHEDAQKWLEKYGNEIVDKYFDIEEGGSNMTFISLRIMSNYAKGCKILAKLKGQSLNVWLTSLIIKALKEGRNDLIAYQEEINKRKAIAEKINHKSKGNE